MKPICCLPILALVLFGCDKKSAAPFPTSFFGETVPCTKHPNIAYGPHQDQNFDWYEPQITLASGSRPLVIFIHGGGFTTNDKNDIPAVMKADIASLLNEGIAFATINYRLLEPGDDEGIRDKCMDDAVRCLKFIKTHAASYGIDKTKIGLMGSSAGAGTCLWIAFGGYDSKAVTTTFGGGIDGQTTKVKAVFAHETQATYDLEKWETEVFNGAIGLSEIVDIVAPDPGDPFSINRLYGMPGPSPQVDETGFFAATAPYREEVDILARIEETYSILPLGQIPSFFVWTNNANSTVAPSTLSADLNHHPLHAVTLVNLANTIPALKYYSFIEFPTGYSNGGYASAAPYFIDKLAP